jgi:hypothetical protein
MSLKKLFIAPLFSILFCAGCGSSTSTPTSASVVASPTSWVGTWSGQVDWTGTGPSDTVSITIAAPVTSPGACGSGENTYTSQFTGTDSGGQCAQNGTIDLVGSVETCSGSYNNNPTATDSGIIPGVQGPNDATCNTFTQTQETWSVSANSITIVLNPGGTVGTLKKQ